MRLPLPVTFLILFACVVSSQTVRAQLSPVDKPPARAPATPQDGQVQSPLVWDALDKRAKPNPKDAEAVFVFEVVNSGSREVAIHSATTSCGCTVAKLPHEPWVLQPGEHGTLSATMDLRGKRGIVTKKITLETSAGRQVLTVSSDIPEASLSVMAAGVRERNQMAAFGDPQAIFRGECAKCHVEPTRGRTGAELFAAACGICHTSEQRASMVPDLAVAAKIARDEAYWRAVITRGKPGTAMAAFAKEHGGILDEAQVDSLVDYLMKHYAANAGAP